MFYSLASVSRMFIAVGELDPNPLTIVSRYSGACCRSTGTVTSISCRQSVQSKAQGSQNPHVVHIDFSACGALARQDSVLISILTIGISVSLISTVVSTMNVMGRLVE